MPVKRRADRALGLLLNEIDSLQPDRIAAQYARRLLPEDLHLEIASRTSGGPLEDGQIEIGWTDVPSRGEQPTFTPSLTHGTLWFVGKRLSGRTHALRCVVDDASRRHPEMAILVLSGSAERDGFGGWSAVPTESPGPYVAISKDPIDAALILRQLAARFMRSDAGEECLLVIDRVDTLRESLVDDDESSTALATIIRGGADRGLYTVVTSARVYEDYIRGGATVTALERLPDRSYPTASTDEIETALLYPTPLSPIESKCAGFAAHLGRPSPRSWTDLLKTAKTHRAAHSVASHLIPIGTDWMTHEPVWIGDTSIVVNGDDRQGSYLRSLSYLFGKPGRTVIQLRGHQDDDWSQGKYPCAKHSIIPDPNWSWEQLAPLVESTMGGVLVAKDVDSRTNAIYGSKEINEGLMRHSWLVLASSQTAIHEDTHSLITKLAYYPECIWLSPETAKASGRVRDMPAWPTTVDRGWGDAFLIRPTGSLTFRRPGGT